MADPNAPCSPWSLRLLSILRIIVAFLFMAHGAQKLFGFLAPPNFAVPPLFSFMGLAGVLEFFGGLAVLVGLFTRPVAFLLSGQMAVAYFLVHARSGFWPLQNKAVLASFAISDMFTFEFLKTSVPEVMAPLNSKCPAA